MRSIGSMTTRTPTRSSKSVFKRASGFAFPNVERPEGCPFGAAFRHGPAWPAPPVANNAHATIFVCFATLLSLAEKNAWGQVMCRNIKPLFNFDPPATNEEIHDAALQFVRKVSGTTKPSKRNEAALERAVSSIAGCACELLDSLETSQPLAIARGLRQRHARERRSGSHNGGLSKDRP